MAYDFFISAWVGVGPVKKSSSNLGVCYGHTNTTKGVTKLNDDGQNIINYKVVSNSVLSFMCRNV